MGKLVMNEKIFESIYANAIKLAESRKIASVEEFFEKDGIKYLAGLLNGKKNIPSYFFEEKGKEYLSAIIKKVLNVFKNDSNYGSDQAIAFAVKVSKTPSNLEDLLRNHFDTVIEYGKCCNSEWFKKSDYVKEIMSATEYSGEDMHLFEKYLQEEHAKRSKSKNVKNSNANTLYNMLYDDGEWKLFVPKNFEGDSELSSHMEPSESYDYESRSNKKLTKATWCTAASEHYYNYYTYDNKYPLYVIQHWINGKYMDAWQLAFTYQPHEKGLGDDEIQLMDKYDKRDTSIIYQLPKELLSKIVDRQGISLLDVYNVDIKSIDDYTFNFINSYLHKNGDELNITYSYACFLKDLDEGGYTLGTTINTSSIDEIEDKSYNPLIKFNFIVPPNVEKIDDNELSGLNIVSVDIPNSVTSIGRRAFKGCTNLTSITIPNNVTSIGNGAFRDCLSLTSITIPDGVTSIGTDAFEGCGSLKEINASQKIMNKFKIGHVVIEDIAKIDDYAFANCNGITSVTIPEGVTSIGDYTFYYCSNLTNINIPESVTSIGEAAFSGCGRLTNINIPKGVTNIDKYTFDSCVELVNVTIPNGVTEIGKCAFNGCKNLVNITLPNSITTIGDKAFYYCVNLTNINIPESVTSIGEAAFEYADELKSVTIPKNCRYLYDSFPRKTIVIEKDITVENSFDSKFFEQIYRVCNN